ncbi:hypothetical protein Taro_048559 [Colocasia esculenta]|uniref:Uncharacterized protein n=1 Tax=Colocasia esculenta TaxID=4460 RepID=A0A843X8G8_COLES|nr:hypothetical protein [Colocasia esculenta]
MGTPCRTPLLLPHFACVSPLRPLSVFLPPWGECEGLWMFVARGRSPRGGWSEEEMAMHTRRPQQVGSSF